MQKFVLLLGLLVCLSVAAAAQTPTQGSLYATNTTGDDLGLCPLKGTSVTADISGFIARVNVRQEFVNTYSEPIEAIYVFPLAARGAVDRMTMTVGERVIRGKIMKREEARAAYDAARSEGKRAALLDQERANIFTQSVANILPGETVVVEISYVETLAYEDGEYQFVFPMTIGPRYNPVGVADAAKITPPAVSRPGHDISINVNIDSGVPIEAIRSTSHDIAQTNFSPTKASVSLRDQAVIPNKDFVLRYDVTGKRIEDAVLANRTEKGGFFSLILQPPDKLGAEDRTPKEIVFVLDTSGSMNGFPIEKAKEAIALSLEGLYPEDTFNLITFAGDTAILFKEPVPATRANLDAAQRFLAGRSGSGGTEMMKAVKASLDPSDAQDHLRIVCFMTDGEIGNDDEIVAEIQRHPKARVFTFGIGSSVNRSLLDRMASEGKGEAEYVSLEDDGSAAARRFYERVRTPILTDLSIDWNGLPVSDVYPTRLTDLFAAKPVVVFGRYSSAATGTIKLRGKIGGQPYEREIKVNLPENDAANDSLAAMWARTRIDELSNTALKAEGSKADEINSEIRDLGLKFGLVTNFTSFVAIEDRLANPSGTSTSVAVPVAAPEGTTGAAGGGGGGATDVYVTGGDGVTIDPTESKLQTNLTSKLINSLPKGTSFTSLLKVSPRVRPEGLSGGFQIDGASGSETVWVIDGQEVSTYRDKKVDLADLVIKLILPDRPKAPNGTVGVAESKVAILVDIHGRVVSASAVGTGGDTAFSENSVRAALATKFLPVASRNKPSRITATLYYSANKDNTVSAKIGDIKMIPATPEELRLLSITMKLHNWLADLLERRKKGISTTNELDALYVHGSSADVTVIVDPADASTLERLKAAGLEVVSVSGDKVQARIAVDKIEALAQLDAVKLILPRY